MPVDVRGRPLQGEFRHWAELVNTLVDQLNVLAREVTRVAHEVGSEGKLGGQAEVPGVAGTWKDLTDNVNAMSSNISDRARNIAEVTKAVAEGDLSRKITVDVRGEFLEQKLTINTMVDQLNVLANEVTRVAHEVGTEGKLGGQAVVPGVAGTWKDLTDNINAMSSNITDRARNIAEVTKAVAEGDLSRKITVSVRGEFLEQKRTINTMVDQLNAFANEVTRVAREVGTEGKLGGQANVRGVGGTWKDLTDSVNFMAGNLTGQVRNIAEVTTAVAQGDLSKKITVDVQGEILELKNTINTMVDQLNGFASEVTRVAREVGTEGKLGGQADVRGVGGTWKDLTDSVNLLAANLTTQVRAIGEVATAVTRGDLSRSVQVVGQRRGRDPQGRHQRDDPAPARHDPRERGAGVAEDESRPLRRPPPGPARSRDGGAAAPVGACAARRHAERRHLPSHRRRRRPDSQAHRHLCAPASAAARGSHRVRRRAGWPVRQREAQDHRRGRAVGLRRHQVRARQGDAPRDPRPAGALRGRGPGRHRACLLRPLHRHAGRLPGTARRQRGHRAQHDRRQQPRGGVLPRAGGPRRGRGRPRSLAPGRRRHAGGHPAGRCDRIGLSAQRGGNRDPGDDSVECARRPRDARGPPPRRVARARRPSSRWHEPSSARRSCAASGWW